MLVLQREKNESITITVPPSDRPRVIELTVLRGKASLGIQAAREVDIVRSEIADRPRRGDNPEAA